MRSVRHGPSFAFLTTIAVGLLGFVTRTTANDCEGRSARACQPCWPQIIAGVGDRISEGDPCPPPNDEIACSGFRQVEPVSNFFCCTEVLSGYVGATGCRPKLKIVVYPRGASVTVEMAVCLWYSTCEWARDGNSCTYGLPQRMWNPLTTTVYCNN